MAMGAALDSFNPDRLRLARTFRGASQSELAAALDIAKSFLSDIERGAKRPSEVVLKVLAQHLGFEESFFRTNSAEPLTETEFHFRKRKTTPVGVRSRALSHGTLFLECVDQIETELRLPPNSLPDLRAHRDEPTDELADRCRIAWGVGLNNPIASLVRTAERAGVITTHFGGYAEKVDAFSRAGRRDIVVMNLAKRSASRSIFDLAHELGHLVLHRGRQTGDPLTEQEADRYAGALLLPRRAFLLEFPRQRHSINWDGLVRMKQRWRVSIAATLHRAYDLELIDAGRYRSAQKYIRWKGWHKGEPAEPPREEPELIRLCLERLRQRHGEDPMKILGRRLRWSPSTVAEVVGVPWHPPRPTAPGGPDDRKVVALPLRPPR